MANDRASRRREERRRAERLDANISKGEKEVREIIRRHDKIVKGTIAESTGKRNFASNASVREKLYKQLEVEYRKLDQDIKAWTINSANKTARDYWNYAHDDLPAGSIGGTFGTFSSKYVSDIVEQINPGTISAQAAVNARIGGMYQADIRALRAAVSTTIAEGAVEGLTYSEMSNRMIDKILKTRPGFQFVDAGGRKWSADNYFGMLNRTLHANVARQSYMAAASSEAGFDLYQIEGGVTGSSIANPGDPCDDWAGEIISLTGKTEGYKTYQDALDDGVFHPNCVHFIRAVLPSEVAAAKQERATERKEAGAL